MPDGVPDGVTEGVPDGNPDGVPVGVPDGKPPGKLLEGEPVGAAASALLACWGDNVSKERDLFEDF